MGVISNIKDKLTKSASNMVSNASTLNAAQLAEVEKAREKYLAGIPDMTGDEAGECIARNLGAVGIEVYQAYLEHLKVFYKPVHPDTDKFDVNNRIRYFDITKWVSDPDEQNLDRLVNVYQVLSEEDCNIALIYHRAKEKCTVSLGVVNTDMDQADPSKVMAYNARLMGAIRGNFPGVEIRHNRGNGDSFGIGMPSYLNDIAGTGEDSPCSVAVVSNLASEKSKDFISQSMEKLLDGMVPKDESEEYTLVLLAKPVLNQLECKNRLFELYSSLSPYASWQTNYTFTQSDSVGSSANLGVNLGLSAGMQASTAISGGTSRQKLYQEDPNDGKWQKLWKKVKGTGATLLGWHTPLQETNSATNTAGAHVGANFGVSFTRSSTVTAQLGSNEGITQSFTNYGVKHTLEIMENQLKRLEESSALGLWDFAAYIIAEDPVMANNVAHMYLALTQGEESYMTKASVSLWDGLEEADAARAILEYIQRLQHPLFGLNYTGDGTQLMYPTLVTPAANLSGKELAKSLNFPRKSVSGLPVLESTSFGREVQKFGGETDTSSANIHIGQVYHMRREEEAKVLLDVNSLASHTFITGSTGAGKSNVVYQLISKLHSQGLHCLIVEPAKGEYKKVFGQQCQVYGTNISKTELLRINPFSFPAGIHVLEHIDRLVEIFNACWPMYAAMPAVLKDAVEKSYEKVGWNLHTSKCDPIIYPTFYDLMETLPEVMNSSLYSQDTKSDYSGALITRVRSLTNGINGQIFCGMRELSDAKLFEQDTIIDLSRVGSSETKSLMMGIIVMKLQEYRINLGAMNANLLHVTVLEEAHNLLRRTSTVQTQEGANLQGKAVEMLTNSIAEMRTYGEGFIIADQAPALLDEAVIRNTNTKIVLRLPDEADRQLVGKALALKDNQITELAKLPLGVAAVYQNDWVEAVLCKFDRYERYQPMEYSPKDDADAFELFFKHVFGVKDNRKLANEDVDSIRDWIHSLRDMPATQTMLTTVLEGKALFEYERGVVAYNVFDGPRAAPLLCADTADEKAVARRITSYWGICDEMLLNAIIQAMSQAIKQTIEAGDSPDSFDVEREMGGERP